MVERTLPYAVTLEDDVCLDNGFAQLVQSVSANALESLFASNEPATIQLSHVNRAFRWPGSGRKPRRRSPRTLRSHLQRIGHELIVKPMFVRRLQKIPT
ncbi:hypothetical protein CR155_02465 [Pollutimonas nitritireducens]|uniref:Uncharacterized protein n=1 Tax=Pollutimonas nitritireducens TaxID=2045209 RepID=A0A2N4UJD5_9BURK|nr:hypothetical protein [Pollutimonas nitritireducens]PLC55095.1 hypothetical protein CR155_02465 [Pollutimonas nitritireducens]